MSGTYSFTGLLAGNYTVTPSLSGYTFSPTSSGGFSLTSDTVKNFTATPNVTLLNNLQEIIIYDLPAGATDLYRAVVPAGIASFVNATRDWVTRRDMLVMYGGLSAMDY